MTENIRKIFDMLGVKPNERFKLDDYKYDYTYYIDENLIIRGDKTNFPSICNILDIITGNVKIIKIPKYEFTKEEKDILRAFKQIGYNYITRDDDGELTLSSDKPHKNITMWTSTYGIIINTKNNIFNSIKWEDSEPFEIPDFEDEPEYETDKEKIKDKLESIFIMTNNKCDNTKCSRCRFTDVSHIDCSYYMALDLLIENGFTFPKNKEEKEEN